MHATTNGADAVVGCLDQGNRANWFIGRPQGTTWCYPGQNWCNDWYAYTEADNGQWGWVPVVYFSGGASELPANALGA